MTLDIETSPNIAHVWGLWQQNVSLAQLRESSFTLCWGAKWHGSKKVEWVNYHDPEMVPRIREMLNEADAVQHFNGDRFDLPILNQEIARLELSPPSPYRSIDLCSVVKKKFRLTSNKLEYTLKYFGLTPKVSHQGHGLWVGVLNDDPKAWAMMKKYNIGDVRSTEELGDRLRPWIDNYPNQQLYGDPDGCPRCGATGTLKKEGHAYTSLGKYQRFRCAGESGCGSWSRSSRRVEGVTEQGAL